MGARGLRILADVTGCVARGLAAEDVLTGVVEALGRGLGTDLARVWVRTPDGAGFRAITPEGVDPPAAVAADTARPWFEQSAPRRMPDGRWLERVALRHDGERLGMLEAAIPDGPEVQTLREVVGVSANVLALLIASVELSEDLASEIAMRTREIESQRRFTSKIIDSLPLGLYVIDRQYLIQAWNRKRETGTQGVGRDEVIGRSVFDVLYRQPRDMLKAEFDRAFLDGEMTQMDVESSASGEARYYRLTKVPMRLSDDDEVTHVITIGEDITEWKRVQDQVSQTEKLAAVGQLAAGVMHEINNPLATIGACVEALTMRVEDLPPVDAQGFGEYLRIMGSELERCKSIVNGLLDFSRPKARVKRRVELNQIVEDALFLVKHHHKYRGIRLERRLAGDLPVILANHEQLIQVFLSLMLNAIDAMEGEGVLSVLWNSASTCWPSSTIPVPASRVTPSPRFSSPSSPPSRPAGARGSGSRSVMGSCRSTGAASWWIRSPAAGRSSRSSSPCGRPARPREGPRGRGRPDRRPVSPARARGAPLRGGSGG